MSEIRDSVDRLRARTIETLIAANGVNPEFGIRDAYSHLAPMVDSDAYMAWLLNEVQQAGCRIVCERITGNLTEQEASLRKQFQVDAIVNCSGLGGQRNVVNDDVYPLRGIADSRRHTNDGKAMPRITQAHCVARDETSSEQDLIFIVPRGRDMLILGGLP